MIKRPRRDRTPLGRIFWLESGPESGPKGISKQLSFHSTWNTLWRHPRHQPVAATPLPTAIRGLQEEEEEEEEEEGVEVFLGRDNAGRTDSCRRRATVSHVLANASLLSPSGGGFPSTAPSAPAPSGAFKVRERAFGSSGSYYYPLRTVGSPTGLLNLRA